MMKNINYLDHPYWIPKCLNVGQISIPLQIFSYIYFPQIFTEIGWMFENVKIPIDHHAIFLFWLFQNLLILLHLSESFDVPAGWGVKKAETLGLHQKPTIVKCFGRIKTHNAMSWLLPSYTNLTIDLCCVHLVCALWICTG